MVTLENDRLIDKIEKIIFLIEYLFNPNRIRACLYFLEEWILFGF